ncbi:competence/damage-inducible protein A [Candidatus Izimaplasma bacterium ZiA1]|uniref:competence/damage-inducible protein A n=1 Tax=Candidatus Izimoplasma sp. ZiA1 TaxID=2024899 RepID=UPI000BAA72BF|nr:competence/damage-inducible protein A [Candidatus Izimaplasma bacterium ZiA1]
MKSTIITVGKEVLTGKTINTNLSDISQNLRKIGIDVLSSFVIDDVYEEFSRVLDIVHEDIIIFTGGLGPTIDDITKESVCKYFGLELVLYPQVLAKIDEYFTRINREMNGFNEKQAYFPKNSYVLENKLGTAPGVIFTAENKTIILFPGPPHELNPMLDDALKYLEKLSKYKYFSKGFKLTGTGESHMEKSLSDFYEKHPEVSIAPYASIGEIKYVFTSKNEIMLEKCLLEFSERYKEFIYGDLESTLESSVVQLLKDENIVISTAESCTGGMLASHIVNVSGSSEVFKEGFVTYSNEAKIRYLDLNPALLQKYGAVSEQCVYQMAFKLHQRTDADVCVSISGIAGPEGGSSDKPVGLVYFGINYKNQTKTYKKIFNGNRHMVRKRATLYALNMIRKELLNV